MAFKMKGMNFGKNTGSFAKKAGEYKDSGMTREELMSKGSGMVERRREQLGLKPKAEARAARLARKTAKLEGKMEGASDRKKARLQRRIDAKTRRIGVKPTDAKVTETKPTKTKVEGDVTKTKTKTKLYSDLPESQRSAAKEFNIDTYGTHNPTATAKRLGITKAELASRHKSRTDLSDKDALDLLTGKSTMTKAAPLKNYKKGYYKKKKKQNFKSTTI